MNLSITNECNRRCRFCFQKGWYLRNSGITELSEDNFERFLSWLVPENFKLMGGEPLLHSKLPRFLDLAREYKKRVSFISNCTLDTDILTENKDIVDGVLVNTHYHKNERDIFLKNIENIVKNNLRFTLSYTLIPDGLKNGSIDKGLKRFREIFSIIPNNFNIVIRLSLMSPDYSNVFRLYDYSYDLVTLITKLYELRRNINFHFDCALNACELNPEVFRVLRKIGARFRTGLCDHCSPKDILVDLSMIWCSASKVVKIDNIFDYQDSEKATDELKKKWDEYWLNTKIMCHHETCGKYNPGICTGFCIGRNEGLLRVENGNR